MTKVLAASASAAIMLAGLGTFAPNPAVAADLFGPLRGTHSSMPQLTPVHIWDGAYFGGFAGATQSNTNFRGGLRDEVAFIVRNTALENALNVSSWLNPRTNNGRARSFGFFAGYNFQFDEAVLGFEADYTRANIRTQAADAIGRSTTTGGVFYNANVNGDIGAEIRDLMTLRARAGYTYGSFLPFVTGGLALANVTINRNVRVVATEQNVDADNNPVGMIRGMDESRNTSKTRTAFGLAAGAGVDVAVTENLFLRGEWQYIHFRDIDGVNANVNQFRAGAGVKF